MFDAVREQGSGPRQRLGAGATLSILLHVGLLGAVLWLSARPPPVEEKTVEVTFKAPPPPPPPPPPPAGVSRPRMEPKVQKKPKKTSPLVQPKEIPQEKAPEVEPTPEEPTETSTPSGASGGVASAGAGGVVGGVVGSAVGGTGTEALPFGEGMNRPEQLNKGDPNAEPQYTREALEARIQGLMIIKCVITVDGHLQKCRIIKDLPHMGPAVLRALSYRRYSPVRYQGRPVQVDYTFNIKLVMPR